MEKGINYKGLKAAILTMSFLQMATNAVASILADIAAAFPQASASGVQYLMTFPNLLVVVMSVVTARLTVIFSKRRLAILGSALGAAAGVLSFLLHGNLILLYIWAGLLGIGIGLVIPIANSLIADYFEGNEKDSLLGLQTSAANIGSMLMTFLGGYLALLGWHFTYFVYLLAIPGLICIFMFVPAKNIASEPADTGKAKSAIPGRAVLYFVIALAFMLAFYVGPTNLAMFVEERGIGNSVTSGTAATILLAGGAIMGFLFGKVASFIGRLTIPVGFLMLTLGFLVLYFSGNIPMLYIGSFLVGTGNTLVLPQCMGSVGTSDKQQTTLLMALCLATANLGTFLAPVVTSLSAAVMGNSLASSRFLFIGLASAILAILSGLAIRSVEGSFR